LAALPALSPLIQNAQSCRRHLDLGIWKRHAFRLRAHAWPVSAMALGYDMTQPALLLQAFIRYGGGDG